jgi:HK97 family phage major capsid protein
MALKLKELYEKRGKAIQACRDILAPAETEGRALTPEEKVSYDKAFKDQADLQDTIKIAERQQELDREGAERTRTEEQARSQAGKTGGERAIGPRATDEYRAAFGRYLLDGNRNITEAELRALSVGNNVQGGYLVAGEQFVTTLIKAIDDLVFIRAKATKYTVGAAQSMGAPSLDADPADADWTSEVLTGSEDSTMAFGKRALTPHPLAKRLKLSKTLVRIASLGVESLVAKRLAYKFAITQEKAFLTGSGANQPLGLFVASNDGIPTSRDVNEGNTTTAIVADNLVAMKYGLKAQYWPRAEWLWSRTAMKQIAQLKESTTNAYIWQPGLQKGQPDMILGAPINMSEYVPATFTTGLYVGMLGDFSNYWIADALDMQLQVLTELYAEANQNGYIGRMETDGMPVLAEAFVRSKLG